MSIPHLRKGVSVLPYSIAMDTLAGKPGRASGKSIPGSRA
jgi:hypothetical protein